MVLIREMCGACNGVAGEDGGSEAGVMLADFPADVVGMESCRTVGR